MSVGLDPEFFIVDGSNHIIPAHLFIPDGPDSDEHVIYDNAAIEIRPGKGNCLIGSIGGVRETIWRALALWRMARKQGKVSQASRLSLAPASPIRGSVIGGPTAQFGCSPSLVVGPGGEIDSSSPLNDPGYPYRSAGFHLHGSSMVMRLKPEAPAFGVKPHLHYYTEKQDIIRSASHYVKLLDCLVGLVDVMMCDHAGWQQQSTIRRMEMGYGLAGEFRVRSTDMSGRTVPILEYRTPSPWLLSHPIWTYWGLSAMKYTIRLRPQLAQEASDSMPPRDEVMDAINTCDANRAFDLWMRSVNAWLEFYEGQYEHSLDASSVLTRLNLRRLLLAINNGGHTYYTTNWSMPRAWFRNERGPGGHEGPRSQYCARYEYRERRKLPTGKRYYKYTGGGAHDVGLRRAWYSGTGHVLKTIYDDPTLPEVTA